MRKMILVSAIIVGGLAATCGPALGLLSAALARLGWAGGPANWLQVGATAVALTALGLGFGLALVWAGWRALNGAPGRILRLPGWGWWLVATAAVLVVGQAVITTRARLLMPVLQVLAGTLPAFMFLALATAGARSRGALTGRRAAAGSLAWGALGGTTLAFLAEMLLVVAAVIAVSIWIGATRPDLLERLQAWADEMRQLDSAQVLSQATRLLTQPAVAVAALGFVGILVPLIEETAKGLAVPLVALTGRRLTSAEGFLLGVAAGAGFAVLEGILNGSLALATPTAWGLLMALRGGATAMHCAATGLAGLGWQLILTQRRWGRGVALGLLAIALHASWNVATLGQAIIAMSGGADGVAPRNALAAAGLMAFMAMLGLLAIAALALIPRYLAVRTALVDGTYLLTKAGAAPMPPASGVGARPASPEILRRYDGTASNAPASPPEIEGEV